MKKHEGTVEGFKGMAKFRSGEMELTRNKQKLTKLSLQSSWSGFIYLFLSVYHRANYRSFYWELEDRVGKMNE